MSYLLPSTNEKSRRRHMWLYFWERIVCVCANTDAPVISCPQEEFSVSVGDRVVLSCSANANPGSLLTWMRSVDGKFTEHITDPTINISIKVGSLTVASCNATKTRRRFTWSMKTVLILSFFYSEKVLARRFFLISRIRSSYSQFRFQQCLVQCCTSVFFPTKLCRSSYAFAIVIVMVHLPLIVIYMFQWFISPVWFPGSCSWVTTNYTHSLFRSFLAVECNVT